MNKHPELKLELLHTPFALTRTVRAQDGAIRRLRSAENDAGRSWRFDLVINPQFVGSDVTTANSYSAAVVELPWRLDGRISITRRGFLRTPQPLAAPELTVGSDALRRRFTVRATSAELAAALLDERCCEWLTGSGQHSHYEIVHDRVLAYSWRRYLGGSGPLRAAAGLAAHLPAPVSER